MKNVQSRWALFLGMLLMVVFAAGCASKKVKPENRTPGDPAALQYNVGNFHMDMRWGRWEQAALYVAESYRQGFLGRYEELGDDFKIVNLEIKGMQMEDGAAEVDVEQESYKMPSMVVEKVRYIEVWKPAEGGGWQLTERTEREEYRAEKKRLAKEKEAAASDDADGKKADGVDAEP